MSVVDEIKDRIDAVELISNYVQLKKAGRNFKGLCPFHSEKTPSFVVFPDTNTWHCFGACSEGGDIFTFVMKQEGWDFRTALEELARQAGVELRPRTEKQEALDQERERLRQALAAAATYYHHLLLNAPQAEPARAYVAQRGFKESTVETFQLGYALDEWHALESYLVDKGFGRQELVEAGLLVEQEERGNVYDRFRGRLMIPIRDRHGRCIGFGARTLDPDGVPKYLNSPQTPLFDKSNTLFGLDVAAKGIRAAERAVVVEGYMDVMQGYQAGFRDIVAQLGTALTEDNLRRLTRHAQRVILALDADAAGQAATMRGLDVAREALKQDWQPVFDVRGLTRMEGRLSADIRVLTLPAGKDPDDLIRQDPARWAALVDQAVPLVEHYVRAVLQDQDLNDPKVKAEVTQTLLPVIRDVADPVERAHYAQRLALSLRVDEKVLLGQVAGPTRRPARRRRPRRPQAVTPRPPRREGASLEIYCLSRLVHMPDLLDQIQAALAELELAPFGPRDLDSPELREIFDTWQGLRQSQESATIQDLAEAVVPALRPQVEAWQTAPLPAIHDRKWLQDAQVRPGQDIFDIQAEEIHQDLLYSILRLRERNLRRRSREVHYLLGEAEASGGKEVAAFRQATVDNTLALRRLQQAIASLPTIGRTAKA